MKCSDCDEPLDVEEEHYYGARCDICERIWFEKMQKADE